MWGNFRLLIACIAASGALASCSNGGAGSGGASSSGCQTSADCSDGQVCIANDNGMPSKCGPCSGAYGDSVAYGVPNSTACIDGKETACADLPKATTCGCECPTGQYCSVSADGNSGKCVPQLAPGAACMGSAMCSSGLCFACLAGACTEAVSGTCALPLGDPCTSSSTDCPYCFASAGQPGWCSEPCGATTSGGVTGSSCTAGVCLGASSAQEWGDCYVACDFADGGLVAQRPGGCPAGTTCKAYQKASGSISSGYACQ